VTLPSTLRLDRLSLTNFRCFSECTITFHPTLTVLIAENGQGKTAILDAIGVALGLFVDTIRGTRQSPAIERSDVRIARDDSNQMHPALPVDLAASGLADGERLSWRRTLNGISPRSRTTSRDAETLRVAGERLRGRLNDFAQGGREAPPPLPIVAFYGTGRLWSEHYLTARRRNPEQSTIGRLAGYADSLSSSSSFKSFVAWYENASNLARSATSIALPADERPERLLSAVREATRTVLEPTQWQEIDWQFPPNDETGTAVGRGFLVVEHPAHGRLPLSSLSDGVRNMIALVADLAHRCVRINPHFGETAARMTPGILLIDEVDMHLHPRWQQLVIQLLQKAFPAMQLVVSTHSPHVLSTVDVESIRVIRLQGTRGVISTPTYQTRGVESADVLAKIMDVDPVPHVEQAGWLSDYRAMVQSGEHESPRGQALWKKLVEHFSVDHPVLTEIAMLRRLQAYTVSPRDT
jgi:predicted ATP-binding protein involved in virulence